MNLPISAIEARILGALIEKELTTPEYYPLTLNSLTNACNQKSNRDPVMTLEEGDLVRALDKLRMKGFARQSAEGGRVPKYCHCLGEKVPPPELAIRHRRDCPSCRREVSPPGAKRCPQQSRWAAALTEVEAEIAWSRGDPEAAEVALREAHTFFRERGEMMEVALGAASLALLLCELGRSDEAAALADEVVADVPGYVLETQIGWHRVNARVLAARGALTDAVSSAEAAVRIARGPDFDVKDAAPFELFPAFLANIDHRPIQGHAHRPPGTRSRRSGRHRPTAPA